MAEGDLELGLVTIGLLCMWGIFVGTVLLGFAVSWRNAKKEGKPAGEWLQSGIGQLGLGCLGFYLTSGFSKLTSLLTGKLLLQLLSVPILFLGSQRGPLPPPLTQPPPVQTSSSQILLSLPGYTPNDFVTLRTPDGLTLSLHIKDIDAAITTPFPNGTIVSKGEETILLYNNQPWSQRDLEESRIIYVPEGTRAIIEDPRHGDYIVPAMTQEDLSSAGEEIPEIFHLMRDGTFIEGYSTIIRPGEQDSAILLHSYSPDGARAYIGTETWIRLNGEWQPEE